jgi:hypothetical protein
MIGNFQLSAEFTLSPRFRHSLVLPDESQDTVGGGQRRRPSPPQIQYQRRVSNRLSAEFRRLETAPLEERFEGPMELFAEVLHDWNIQIAIWLLRQSEKIVNFLYCRSTRRPPWIWTLSG